MGRKPKVTFKSRSSPTNLELALFFFLIFLIPTNLSLTLSKSQAFVNGILVDYLIPKLYISDIVIISLITAWFTRLPFSPEFTNSATTNITTYLIPPKKQRTKPYFTTLIHSKFLLTISFFSLLATVLFGSILSTNPLPSVWTLIKIIQFALLTLWIKTNLNSVNLLKTPIAITLIFQSLVAIIQWFQQKSILGYLFLGETTLRNTSQIAKTSFGGTLRPLPYGTTAHPNILGGFLSLGIILITANTPYQTIKKSKLLTGTLLLSATALLLTQSLSAWLALATSLLLLKARHLTAKHRLGLLLIIPLIIIATLNTLPKESITKRVQLIKISSQMIAQNPIFGVGVDNFTARMNQYGQVPGNTRFLQPVHNIYLLTISEIGLAGLISLLGLAYFFILHADKRKHIPTPLALPLLTLLLIGLADHYPTSLQTGQLLLALTVGLSLTYPPKRTL